MTRIRRSIVLPEDLQRAKSVVEARDPMHDAKLIDDFENNREQYREVELYGLKVLVKVETKE